MAFLFLIFVITFPVAIFCLVAKKVKNEDYFHAESEYYYIESLFRNIVSRDEYMIVRASEQYYIMFDKLKMHNFPGDRFPRAAGIILTEEETFFAARNPQYTFQYFVDKKTKEENCTWVPLNDSTFSKLQVAREKALAAIDRNEEYIDGKKIITSDDIVAIASEAKEAQKAYEKADKVEEV